MYDFLGIAAVVALGAWWVWNNFLGQTQKNFLSGGTSKVVANDIADLFRKCGSSYEKTVVIKYSSLMQAAHKANNPEPFYTMLYGGDFDNFTELALLELHAFAAPRGTAWEHTYSDFYGKVVSYLRERRVPEQYITGTNALE